jgi:hypothetical protein
MLRCLKIFAWNQFFIIKIRKALIISKICCKPSFLYEYQEKILPNISIFYQMGKIE